MAVMTLMKVMVCVGKKSGAGWPCALLALNAAGLGPYKEAHRSRHTLAQPLPGVPRVCPNGGGRRGLESKSSYDFPSG